MSNFGKGIPLSIGFDLGSKQPLDSRTVVDSIVERDLLVTKGLAYEGLTVYVKDIQKVFRYDGTQWIDTSDYYSKSEVDNILNDAVIGNVNLTNYYTRSEVDSKIADIDDCFYIGEEEPLDDKVWFSNSSKTISNITYDNPIISELFSCIQDLQSQIKSLQAEVEYLKIHGGGSIPDMPEIDDTETYYALLLEDGSPLLLEDGGLLLLEDTPTSSTITDALLLDDNEVLLIDDDTYFKI